MIVMNSARIYTASSESTNLFRLYNADTLSHKLACSRRDDGDEYVSHRNAIIISGQIVITIPRAKGANSAKRLHLANIISIKTGLAKMLMHTPSNHM